MGYIGINRKMQKLVYEEAARTKFGNGSSRAALLERLV
jgi:hypothetical protein